MFNFLRTKTTEPIVPPALCDGLKSRPGEMYVGPNFLATYSEGIGATFVVPVDDTSKHTDTELERTLVVEYQKFINDPTIQKF